VEAGSLGIGTSIVTRAGPQMAVASVTWEKNKAQELASGGGLGGYTVYNLTVDGDHTFFVGTTGGGTWVHNSCPDEFKEEAIRLAEEGGYRPSESQRDVDWNKVQELTDLAKQNGNWDFLWGDELIISGKDGAWTTIDNGMHRILASKMSGVPLPDEMFLNGDYFSPSRSWR
jgi:hypothetical protein